MMNVLRGIVAIGVLFVAQAAMATPGISFFPTEGRMTILIDEQPFAEYVWKDDKVPRPFFRNIIAPNGMQVTRGYPTDPVLDKGNADHDTYHPGIWMAFGDISGTDFWRNRARVRQVGFTRSPQAGATSGSFEVLNVYETNDSPPKLICEEHCAYTIQKTALGYLLTATSTFSNRNEAFTFGDQEEMGLGFRLATDLRVKSGNGFILNSAGGKQEAGTWGKEAAWCAGYGIRDDALLGMNVMSAPDNFRPSWNHSRDYGLIVANPFGKKAMIGPDDDNVPADSTPVKAGKTITVGFGVYVFSQSADTPLDLDTMYQDYLKRK